LIVYFKPNYVCISESSATKKFTNFIHNV
jgi:hypothetical protein